VCEAHRHVFHTTLGWRVIKKKKTFSSARISSSRPGARSSRSLYIIPSARSLHHAHAVSWEISRVPRTPIAAALAPLEGYGERNLCAPTSTAVANSWNIS